MLRAALPSAAGPAASRARARESRRRACSRPNARVGARVEGPGAPTPSSPRSVADARGDDKPRHNRRGDNASRDRFADDLRETHSGGRVSKRDFKAHLGRLSDPPAALRDVTVVLVGTKKAGNVGAVARACGSFECEDLRLVSPRCDPRTRASLSAAKGAQHIVHGAGVYDSLEDALLDVEKAVAFHVWCEGLEPAVARDVEALIETFPGGVGSRRREDDEDDSDRNPSFPKRDPRTEDPVVPLRVGSRRSRIRPTSPSETDARPVVPEATREDEDEDEDENETRRHGWRRREHVNPPRLRAGRGSGKLALVFGREVEGLEDWEVNACDAVCAIPTGRLVESLSVSHAAVIILSQYYQSRRARGDEKGETRS